MNNLDLLIVYRIVKILATPWVDQEAYKLGIIDDRGRVQKKSTTFIGDHPGYTILHRFVFNLKRLIELVPGGKSKIATYAAALLLLREESDEINTIDGTSSADLDELFELQMMEDGEGGTPAPPTNNISSGAVDITPHWIPDNRKRKLKIKGN